MSSKQPNKVNRMAYGTGAPYLAIDLSMESSPTGTSSVSRSPSGEAPQVPLEIEHYRHHHHHHSIRHNTHRHMHHGMRAETLVTRNSIPDISLTAITGEPPTTEGASSLATDSLAGTSPPDNVRGRSRIVRRVTRSSSSESTCSSRTGEQDLALINSVAELVTKYKETGEYKELARIAREEGIPASLRRIVWPILLENHPFVVEKSLAKEYRHSTESYTPRHIPINRIKTECGRYHRRKSHTPSTRNSSPPSSTSPAAINNTSPVTSLPSDPSKIDPSLDQGSLDLAVENAIVSFLEKHDGVSYSRGMVYVCFALAEWIYIPPSALAAAASEGVAVEDPESQAKLLAKCFEQMMCIMLWAPPMQAPAGRMEGVTEQKISTFLTECRQLVPELCVILDDEEALGFEEEWVQSWVQWWCAKEIGKNTRGRLWDWHLGYEKPPQKQDGSGPVPDDGFEEAFTPSDWHILVCVALLKCLHDHVDDLEQSEIRSLLSNIPDRKLGSMSKIIEVAKNFRKQLKEIREQEDEEYSGRASESNSTA
ncbi:hypothetical protein BDZ91DRAFT_790468 [Kalaharituber pfeilii]|nr:hypothetical protein BDZ91DRAFT_790468 [Kalaharituber pfeilii]